MEGSRRILVQKFQLNTTTGKQFPKKTPIVKKIRFRQRYNVSESGQFLQSGSMGKFFIFCRIHLKFRPRVRLKRLNNRAEYELGRTKSKDDIAEYSIALGHDTHNRLFFFYYKPEASCAVLTINTYPSLLKQLI